MQNINCARCGTITRFDPETTWSSLISNHEPGTNVSPTVAIRCQQCKEWLTVKLTDDDSAQPMRDDRL